MISEEDRLLSGVFDMSDIAAGIEGVGEILQIAADRASS